jgi:hypothetical protein
MGRGYLSLFAGRERLRPGRNFLDPSTLSSGQVTIWHLGWIDCRSGIGGRAGHSIDRAQQYHRRHVGLRTAASGVGGLEIGRERQVLIPAGKRFPGRIGLQYQDVAGLHGIASSVCSLSSGHHAWLVEAPRPSG